MNTATQQRDAGMAQALGHANAVVEDWSERASRWLDHWCMGYGSGKQFTSHEFISWVERTQLPEFLPPTNKAFGSIFTRFARNGLIRKVGYRPHPLRHASPTVLWEVV